jgi:hypothetical protein
MLATMEEPPILQASMESILAAAGWTLEELAEAAALPWSPIDANITPSAGNRVEVDPMIDITLMLSFHNLSSPERETKSEQKENFAVNFSQPFPASPPPKSISEGCQPPSISKRDQFSYLDDELSNGWTLFPHQKEAVKRAVELKRVILAYDMGLGKTCISLVWALEMQKAFAKRSCITIIVCPCTLTENWRREATALGFFEYDSPNAASQHAKLAPSSSSMETSSAAMMLCSWASLPEPKDIAELTQNRYSGMLLICDEAHHMQCLKSQRTSLALRLALHPACRGLILSTGTPLKNGRPSNILPLLMAIRHPVAKDIKYFEKRYCDAKNTRYMKI